MFGGFLFFALMALDLVFYTGLAFLVVHELDAIHRHEWKMFPFISRLNDRSGYQVFVLLHIPLLVLIFWLVSHPPGTVRFWFQVSMNVFFMVHFGLHYLMREHEHSEFSEGFSKLIVALTAAAGLIHLMLLFVGA